MNAKEKEAIVDFMNILMYKFHPNYNEYPWQAMRDADYTKGEGLDGSEFEGTYMAEAFYMQQAIDKLVKG